MPPTQEEIFEVFRDIRDALQKMNMTMTGTNLILREMQRAEERRATTIQPVESARPPKNWQRNRP